MSPATEEELPATISIGEASELLGVSRRTGYRAAHQDQIPTFRIGRRIFVPTRPFLEMLGLEPGEAAVFLGLGGDEEQRA